MYYKDTYGVKKNDRNGEWSNIADKNLPNSETVFLFDFQFGLGGLLSHQPACENCHAYAAKRKHQVGSDVVQQVEKV